MELTNNQIEEISEVTFNKITKRGISTKLISQIKQITGEADVAVYTKNCWSIGKAIIDNNIDPNKSNIKIQLRKHFTTQKPKTTATRRLNGKEMDDAGMEIASNEELTKNDRIRELLSKNYSITEIAKSMDLTYQRVKSVKINSLVKELGALNSAEELTQACKERNIEVGKMVYNKAIKIINKKANK